MVAGAPLHIVRKRVDPLAVAVIAEQRRQGPVGVVLVQDATLAEVPSGVQVWVSDEDVTARSLRTLHQRIGYEEIARLVVEASTVMIW